MAEAVAITANADKQTMYDEIVPQLDALVSGETDLIANLANISAVLKEVFGFFWVGFYLARDGELVLGPFQGPLACTRIAFGAGVCGQAYAAQQTIIVPDVDQFPGHIACSSASRSEIVVPIRGNDGNVLGVLDVDSDELSKFDDTDAAGLERVVRIVERLI